MENYTAVVDFPFARLAIVAHGLVQRVEFVGKDVALLAPCNELSVEVCRQLWAYAEDAQFAFSLPLEHEGTEYRLRIWAALREIPVGEVRSYGALAKQTGSGPRAVGGACRHNPIPVITPCHRIVSAHSMGGFAGQKESSKTQDLLEIKRWLLRHEGVVF